MLCDTKMFEAIGGAKTNHKDLPDLVTLLTFNPSNSRGYNIALDVLKNDIITLLKFTSKEKFVKHCVL